MEAKVELFAMIDPADVVDGLNNNDENILAFVVEILERAASSDLRERLSSRLNTWSEDHMDD